MNEIFVTNCDVLKGVAELNDGKLNFTDPLEGQLMCIENTNTQRNTKEKYQLNTFQGTQSHFLKELLRFFNNSIVCRMSFRGRLTLVW